MSVKLLDLYNKVASQSWSMFDNDAAETDDFEPALISAINKALVEIWVSYPFEFRKKEKQILTQKYINRYALPDGTIMRKHTKNGDTYSVMISRKYMDFIENPDESKLQILGVAVVSLVLCIGNFYFGKYLSPKRFRRETSQLLGQKNTTFTMYLALTYAGPLVAMGPIFYVLWHNTWNAYQMYQYDCRTFQRIQRREHPDAGELH